MFINFVVSEIAKFINFLNNNMDKSQKIFYLGPLIITNSLL